MKEIINYTRALIIILGPGTRVAQREISQGNFLEKKGSDPRLGGVREKMFFASRDVKNRQNPRFFIDVYWKYIEQVFARG